MALAHFHNLPSEREEPSDEKPFSLRWQADLMPGIG
jgi:hypothetical protein